MNAWPGTTMVRWRLSMELVRVGQQRDSDGERPEDGLNSKAGGLVFHIHSPCGSLAWPEELRAVKDTVRARTADHARTPRGL